jgi:hypothetical protein
MYEARVCWETAHAVPNLPQFLRDWTQQWPAAGKIVTPEPSPSRAACERGSSARAFQIEVSGPAGTSDNCPPLRWRVSCAERHTRAAGTPEMPPKPDNYFNRPYGTEINSVQDPALKRRATIKRSYGTRSPELRLLLNICVRMVSDKSSLQSLRLLS